MKHWMSQISKEIINVKQESHVVLYYKKQTEYELQARLTEACLNDTSHTSRLAL